MLRQVTLAPSEGIDSIAGGSMSGSPLSCFYSRCPCMFRGIDCILSAETNFIYIYSSARAINLNHSDIVYLQTQLCVYLLMYIQGGYPRASHVKNTEYSILSFSHFHVMLS